MNFKSLVYSFLAVLFLISCDNETSGLGSSLTPDTDVITVKADSSFATSRTIISPDSLLILSSQCNLGRFTEAYSGTTFESGFLAQFNCMENFKMADSIYGVGNHQFPAWFDSVVADRKPFYANLKLYYTRFFGDSTNTVKIDVFPLDKMIDVNRRYYSNLDPSEFCNTSVQPLASTTVSAWNLQLSDSIRYLTDYYPTVTIPLPDSVAKVILESYDNPATRYYFSDATSFMQNLVKGFYVRCTQGDGTMFYIDHSVLEVNFKYISYASGTPKMESLMAEFPSNTEVLQLNTFHWTNLEPQLRSEGSTWIRSPFGLLTEITLPVDDMRDDEYVLNSALLRISTAVTPGSRFKPSTPPTLLLIRKDMARQFFSRNNITDDTESFVTSYASKYGSYTFENIAALVEKIYNDRAQWLSDNGMANDSTSLTAYEAARPDWNKVLLIPVAYNKDSRGKATSYSLDINMHQVKLIGGEGNPIKIKTIRSKF